MDIALLEKLPRTPMWIQYSAIKKEALDALLFYRMGDFYELFLDDAIEAAEILNITLTARNKKEELPIAMCGVPFHSATNYINRLLQAGKRVAICEQIEDPAAAKGIVKREIVRVVSPGMAFDSDALDSNRNNYLLVLRPAEAGEQGAYCVTDVSTGSMEYSLYSSLDQLRDDLSLLQPQEVAAPSAVIGTSSWQELVHRVGPEYFPCVSPFPDFFFSPEHSAQELCRHFEVLNLEGFGLSPEHPAIGAAGAALRIVRDAQKQGDLRHLRPPTPRLREGFIQLDESTIEHLDLFPKPGQNPAESAFHHLDRTCTSMGARRLREVLSRPLAEATAILFRQNAILELKSKPSLLRRIRQELSGIRDLERLVAKIGLRTASPRDLQALQLIFKRLPALKDILRDAESSLLLQQECGIEPFLDLHAYLDSRLREELPTHSREGNLFKPGWHAKLDELIQLTEDGQKLLLEMEERERRDSGISSLKIKYNRVFGYFIEVTNSNLASVPSHYIRKQTTAGGERFLTEELKKFEERVLSAQEKRIALEESLFQSALARVGQESQSILSTARELAMLDALASLASAAVEHGYEPPVITEENILEIEAGRHPALEKIVGRDKFIANSSHFTAKERVFLLTGPNMAGKSTYMRQVALIALLAHTGSLVPARSARVGLMDRIATRVGASDRIGRGQSTFMVEMNEMAKILRQSTTRSLLIIDEIGRGTSTFDGMALAWAILEDIVGRLDCRTLFATHYHELTALDQKFDSVRNISVAVEERLGEVVFLHEVREGKAPGSYGVEVARLAGLPLPVVERAREVLELLEKNSEKSYKRQSEALTKAKQLSFFSTSSSIGEEREKALEHLQNLELALRSLDIDHCSPFHALETLKTWKEALPRKSPPC